jgi:hypothetical protein
MWYSSLKERARIYFVYITFAAASLTLVMYILYHHHYKISTFKISSQNEEFSVYNQIAVNNDRRKLSLSFDFFTGESVRTYNGHVPVVSCPAG